MSFKLLDRFHILFLCRYTKKEWIGEATFSMATLRRTTLIQWRLSVTIKKATVGNSDAGGCVAISLVMLNDVTPNNLQSVLIRSKKNFVIQSVSIELWLEFRKLLTTILTIILRGGGCLMNSDESCYKASQMTIRSSWIPTVIFVYYSILRIGQIKAVFSSIKTISLTNDLFFSLPDLPSSGKKLLPLQQIRWTVILIKWSSILFSAATAADFTATPAPTDSAPSATKSRSRRSSNLHPTCRRRWHRRRQSPSKSRVRLPHRQPQSKPRHPQFCSRTR